MNDVTHLDAPHELSPSLADIQQFLYKEAQLLDQGHFTDWLDLFVEDGIYWIPAIPNQTDPLSTPSIIYDNKDLLTMRVRRLSDPRTYTTMAPPRTTRIVGNVMLGKPQQDETLTVYSTAFIHECREENRRLFTAQCSHVLRNTESGLKIVSKRVDLLDCDTVHAAFMSLL